MVDMWFYSGTNPKLKSDYDTANEVHTPKVIIDGVVIDAGVIEFGAIAIKDGASGNLAAVDVLGRVSVDGSSVTQPISAASLPLPSGASTSANQATAISTLGNINTGISLLAKLTDTQPVSIAGTVTVSGPLTDTQLRASAVPVSLASTTITGTVTVTGTVAATQSGTWNIGSITTLPVGHNIIDSGVITSISNPVAVTQSGTWTVGLNAGSAVIGHVIVDSGAVTATVTGSVTVTSGNVTATLAAGSAVIGHVIIDSGTITAIVASTTITSGNITVNNGNLTSAVNIQDGGNSITVDGTFFQTTQPVSDANLELTQGAVGTSSVGPVVMGIVLPTISGIPGTIGALPLTNDGRVAVKCNGDDLDFFGTENDIWTKSEFPSFGPDLF